MKCINVPTNLGNFSSNASVIPRAEHVQGDEYEAFWERMYLFNMVIYSLIFLLGVTGNGLVIFITSFRMKRTVNTVWFLNLAIADFAFTSCLPFIITEIALRCWPFGPVMCKFQSAFNYLNLYASIYLLMAMSLDRCICTNWPVWTQNHRTPQRASIVAFGVWILASVLSSPHFYFSKEIEFTTLYDKNVSVCVVDYGSTQEQRRFIHQAMIISQFIFAFVIPFSVIVVCYGAIVLKLRKNRKTQSKKPFKVITAVTVAFFVCWLPCHVFFFLEKEPGNNEPKSKFFITGERLAYCLAYLNSCLNPILYAFMAYDFKQKLRQSLLSAFGNVLAEDSSQSTGSTDIKSSAVLEFE